MTTICINMIYSDDLNHRATKHINNKFHYTKELVKQCVVQIRHLATKEMAKDSFTIPLFVAQHHKLLTTMINLQDNMIRNLFERPYIFEQFILF